MALRVLYSFPDALGKPGIGSIARAQAAGLVEQGCEVALSVTSWRAPVAGVASARRSLVVAGQRVPHRAVGIARAQRWHDRRTAGLVRPGGFDVVHVWPGAALATARAARAAGIPVVREVPNTHTAHAVEVASREAAALGLRHEAGHSHAFDAARLAREEAEYAAADALLVPSEHARETFLARGFAGERLLLHRYGCDPSRFSPAPASPGADPSRGLTALFVGRCEPRKGLHHALRAWRDSGAAERGRFVVCGSFVPGYREALGDLLDGVEVRGFVDDVAAVMREADLLVFPSVEEGTALVTYEAQAAGLVLVVSDAAGARCVDGVHGLVHRAGDVATLAEHLRALDRDRDLLARLRAGALGHVEELTWSAAARELVDCYRAARALRA